MIVKEKNPRETPWRDTHSHTLLSFVFSLHLFYGTLEVVRVPHLTFNSLHQCHSPLYAWKKRVICWWMSFVCLSFVFTLRYSFVSVVFDFSASLNDVAPASPISVSVDDDKWKWWIVDGHLLCVFCFHHLNRVLWVLCLILVLHLMMLLLCLQYCSLSMWRKESELLVDAYYVSSLLTTQIEFGEHCV